MEPDNKKYKISKSKDCDTSGFIKAWLAKFKHNHKYKLIKDQPIKTCKLILWD